MSKKTYILLIRITKKEQSTNGELLRYESLYKLGCYWKL